MSTRKGYPNSRVFFNFCKTHVFSFLNKTHKRPSKIKMQNLFTHFRGKVAVKSLKSTVKKPKSLVNNKNPQQKYRLYDHFIRMLVQIA